MARNPDHYAVVIGLSRYPGLDNPAPNLEGPGNDADAIYNWLIDENGGGLPKGNVEPVIKSLPAPDGAPDSAQVQAAFARLVDLAEQRRGTSAQLGTRLYIYGSGHGFSPTLNQACLHTGDATPLSLNTNISFSKWLELFQDAGYFRETVLWMDCCMNRDTRSGVGLPTRQTLVSPDTSGPSFIAFAARRPLRAVEKKLPPEEDVPPGKFHGVFTTILIEGLRGAAANPYGMITGRSLADWLRNAQAGRLDETDLNDPKVSREPEIVREDQELIFARGVVPMAFTTVLKFADAAGQQAYLWSRRPPRRETLTVSAANEIKLPLTPGMYLIELPAQGLRQGFQVTGTTEVMVNKIGRPVAPTDQIVPFIIEPNDPAAEIFVVDEAFNLVDRGVGKLELNLPFGIYKVRMRSGRRTSEAVHLLDEIPPPQVEAAMPLAPFRSAAPLADTAFAHEYHEAAAHAASARTDLAIGAGGQIMVMARQWRADDATPSSFEPWAGVQLLDREGAIIASLDSQGVRSSEMDPWGTLTVDLDPGAYLLSTLDENGKERRQTLIVSPGWRTEAYLLTAADPGSEPGPTPIRLSILMHRLGEAPCPKGDLYVDQARVALADERLILGGEFLDDLLIKKVDNPIAGINGAHLLLIDKARNNGGEVADLDTIVGNLRGLVGIGHPDVEALSLRCIGANMAPQAPPVAPPMFRASWKLLVDGSQMRPDLISAELWNEVQAQLSLDPYLSWAADEDAKQLSQQAIAATMLAVPELVMANVIGIDPQAVDLVEAPSSAATSDMMTIFKDMMTDKRLPAAEDLIASATIVWNAAAPGLRAIAENAIDSRLKALGLPKIAFTLTPRNTDL